MNMFFSIIIPIYNAEEKLSRCLDSITAQYFSDFEVVMIDDGSSDSSAKICGRYTETDERFRYYYFDNGGVAKSRNRGIDLAQAPYVVFIDSDDSYSPEYLKKFYDLIASDPSCGHFWCGYSMLSDDPNADQVQRTFDPGSKIVTADRSVFMTLYDKFLLAAVWNKVFRRDILIKHRIIMPEDLSLGEDLLFNLDYLDCSDDPRIMIINEPMYLYTCGTGQSLNTRYRPDLKEIYERLSDGLTAYANKWGVDKNESEKCSLAVFSMMFRAMKNCFHPMNTEPHRKKVAQCREIMNSGRFRDSVKNVRGAVHPLYRFAFALRDYRLILLTDKAVGFKNRMMKRAPK